MRSTELQRQAIEKTDVSQRTYDAARVQVQVRNKQNPESKKHEHWSKLPGQQFLWEAKKRQPRAK